MRNFILEELADALDDRSGQFRYFFLSATGRVEPYAADDQAAFDVSTRADVIGVKPLTHAEAHQLVFDFIDTLADGALADRLREAASGPSAGARFLQVLSAFPRARRSWLAFRQRRLQAIALGWLRSNSIELGRYGLDMPPRPDEEATGLRFDAALEQRLQTLRLQVDELRTEERLSDAEAATHDVFRLDEVFHSNAVRGNRLTRQQTEELLAKGTCVGGLALREHLEAVNLHRALARAEVLGRSSAPLTEHGIRELHALLFVSIDDENAGAYRRIDTRLVGRDYLPPESALVPGLLREFTEWLEESRVDPVAKATAAQAKILNLSPFLDGNGRVGRLLSNLILHAAGYPPAIVRLDDARRYYEGLRQADSGDMTKLLALMIERVEESSTRLNAALS